jgi:hypothetical protein
MTPLGIEPATFRPLCQRLNGLRHRVVVLCCVPCLMLKCFFGLTRSSETAVPPLTYPVNATVTAPVSQAACRTSSCQSGEAQSRWASPGFPIRFAQKFIILS